VSPAPVAVTLIVLVPLPAHTAVGATGCTVIDGGLFTVMFTVLEVAGLPVVHTALDVSMQITASPFMGVYVKVELLVPCGLPFTLHWYDGVVPSLVGVAVKVTDVPAQTGFAEGAILTLTRRIGFTVIATVLEVAGLPDVQVSLEVRTTVTLSPLAGV
jgi:hypothetical protein